MLLVYKNGFHTWESIKTSKVPNLGLGDGEKVTIKNKHSPPSVDDLFDQL